MEATQQEEEPPTAENEVFRASLCGPEGFVDFIETTGDLGALKAEADAKFPADKVVVVQSDQVLDTAEKRTRVRYRNAPRGRLVARRYPSGGGFVWRDEP